MVFTEIGPVQIEVPRVNDSLSAPQIVKNRQRRLTGIDEIVLSLTAMGGLTTGEVSAHFQDVYGGATVLKDIISWITDKVVGEVIQWQNRSLDRGGGLH